MIRNLFFFLSCTVIIGACSTSENPGDNIKTLSDEIKIEQPTSNLVCLNHSLLVLDSTTYHAVVNSEFLGHFAFSYEKQLTGYHGFYLIGKTNYLEMFNATSFDGEELENGAAWIFLASLKANYLEKLNKENLDITEFNYEDDYYFLSPMMKDTISQLTTWEIGKDRFESWTKKEYNDSMTFLPVDYNSPQESDSSANYLMNDVNGIGLSLHPDDSLTVTNYLNVIGYDSVSEVKGHTRLSSNNQFIELHISNDNKWLSINRYYIQLNKSVERSTEVIGNSRIECDGKSAIWIFD